MNVWGEHENDRRTKIGNIDERREIRRVLFVVGIEKKKHDGRDWKRVVWWDLPLLYTGRTVHFPFKNPNEQRLRIRLQILPQSAERGRRANDDYATRNLRADDGFL